MKRNILLLGALIISTIALQAQNEQDALRYSFLQTGGTARSLSMGGAFGALGGDFSSLSTNPAGLGIYRSSEFAFTPDFTSVNTGANFLGSNSSDSRYRMSFSHFGLVVPLGRKNSSGTGLRGVNFAIGYNKLADFNQNVTMQGINTSSSLADEFVSTANTYTDLDPFTDGLAYETGLLILDTITGYFHSDFDGSNYGQTQRRTISKRGQVGEYVFGLSSNISEKFFIGASMGIQRANYIETWDHSELDPQDLIDTLNGFSYGNRLSVTGKGINFKVGFIFKPIEFIRIGGALHTPTFYDLNDTFEATLATNLAYGLGVHEWDAYGEYDYEITTPFRAVGSLAFVFQKYGLISVDYEYVDYSQARLRSYDYDFYDENQAVNDRYRATSNLRIGAEYRFLNLAFRGGFAFYQSPYANTPTEPNRAHNLTVLSGGIGYRDRNFFIDLGVSRSKYDETYFLYADNSANLEAKRTRFTATLGYKF